MCKYCEPQEEYEQDYFYHKLNYKNFSGRWEDISIPDVKNIFLTYRNNNYTLDIDVGYDDNFDCDGIHSIERLPIHECPICGRKF